MPINDPFLDEMSVAVPRGTSGAPLATPDLSSVMIDDGGFRQDYDRQKQERQSSMTLQERLMDDFNDSFERANNDYQGLLSVGAPPEVAAASTIKPVLAKYQAMTPLIRSFTGNTAGRRADYGIVNLGGGAAGRFNKFTGEYDPIETGREGLDATGKINSDRLKFYSSELSKVKSRIGDSKYRSVQDDLLLDASDLQQKISELEGKIAPPQPGRTAPGMDADPFQMQSSTEAPAEDAPRDPKLRKINTVYNTPKGRLKWTGVSWSTP